MPTELRVAPHLLRRYAQFLVATSQRRAVCRVEHVVRIGEEHEGARVPADERRGDLSQ